MLTPKETGGQGGAFLYPVDIPYSALLEAGYSSTGAVGTNATMALSFKPTVVNPAKPLSDPSNHYLLLIQKTGTSVEVFKNGTSLGTYATSATTFAGLLAEALTSCCGSAVGYFSNLYVVDGTVHPVGTFFELSSRVADLWVWKNDITLDYGTYGGHYDFASALPASTVLVGGTSGGDFYYGSADPLFDGSESTFWFSLAAPSSCWYDLGEGNSATCAAYMIGTTAGGSYPTGWKVEVSSDSTDGVNGTWTTIDTVTGSSALIGVGLKYYGYADTPVEFRFLRFTVLSVNTGTHCNTLGLMSVFDTGVLFGLGDDVSGNGNHWTVSGTQSDDTPTHNGGVAAWEAMAEPLIRDMSKYADIVLRTGTGDVATIDSYRFTPGWVSIKDRGAQSWYLWDDVRGAQKALSTNTTDAEMIFAGGVTSFDQNGYTVGVMGGVNYSGSQFVDLALKAGPKSGFDIVTWDGDGVLGRQIAHNLGKAPTFIIIRRTSAEGIWVVYHTALGATMKLSLSETLAADGTALFNSAEPTSTYFTVGDNWRVNGVGATYVAYIFTDSDVFRAFSYTGNALADGPVVDLGGRPLSIPFLKNTQYAADWLNLDTVRTPANGSDAVLRPNTSSMEATQECITYRSNGFKIGSTTEVAINGGGDLHVGLAVMRQPHKYSNAF